MVQDTRLPHRVQEWARSQPSGLASERDAGRADNPVVLSDVFCRVGGGAPAGDARAARENGAAARALVVVRGAHVVGDNLWLWRADHTALAPGEALPLERAGVTVVRALASAPGHAESAVAMRSFTVVRPEYDEHPCANRAAARRAAATAGAGAPADPWREDDAALGVGTGGVIPGRGRGTSAVFK